MIDWANAPKLTEQNRVNSILFKIKSSGIKLKKPLQTIMPGEVYVIKSGLYER